MKNNRNDTEAWDDSSPPGVSGNANGRPKGSRNKRTVLVEALRREKPADLLKLNIGLCEAIWRYFESRKELTLCDVRLAAEVLSTTLETVIEAEKLRRQS